LKAFFLTTRHLTRKLTNKLYTFYYLIKYCFSISSSEGVLIYKGFKLINFSNKTKSLNVMLKKNSRIKFNVIIQGTGTFILGENSYLSHGTIIGVNDKIIIGDNVMIAANVSMRDTNHNFSDKNISMINQGLISKPIYIQDNVWIGHGAVITNGVTLKTGAIVAANAVVTKDVPVNAIVGGVPAKVLKYRYD